MARLEIEGARKEFPLFSSATLQSEISVLQIVTEQDRTTSVLGEQVQRIAVLYHKSLPDYVFPSELCLQVSGQEHQDGSDASVLDQEEVPWHTVLVDRQHPLLTLEEEQVLGYAVFLGRSVQECLQDSEYADYVSQHRVELQHIVEVAEFAVDVLIAANQRLVAFIARDSLGGLPFPDRYSAGVEGLIKGIVRFDYRRGYRISTYVSDWIRTEISRANQKQGHTMSMPEWRIQDVTKVRKDALILYHVLSREPTVAEMQDYYRSCGQTVAQETIEFALKSLSVSSLDELEASRLPVSSSQVISSEELTETDDFLNTVRNILEKAVRNFLGNCINQACIPAATTAILSYFLYKSSIIGERQSLKAIAYQIGVSERTLSSKMSDIIGHLREELIKLGYSVSGFVGPRGDVED